MSESDEVRRTLHAYCRMLDDRRLDRIDQIYTADAVDDRRRGEPLAGLTRIRGYFERSFEHVEYTAHILSNIDVDLDDDTARSYSRVTAYHWMFGGDPVRAADFVVLGSYDDELTRTAAGWRITSRRVTALGQAGLCAGVLPEVFAGFGGKGVTDPSGAS